MAGTANRKARGHYEHYSYALIFEGALHALKHTEEGRPGSFYHCLNAMLLSAFCVEAYLNHVGPEVFRDWDEDVKRGCSTIGKLKIICSKLSIPPELTKRLYADTRMLSRFRNQVAHARTESGEFESGVDDRGDVEVPKMKWDKACTADNAKVYVNSARDIVSTLHRKAGLPEPAFGVVESRTYSF